MPGRGRIYDDARIVALAIEFTQFEQSHHLVHTRQREVEETLNVTIVEQRSTIRNDPKHISMAFFEIVKGGDGIHLPGFEHCAILSCHSFDTVADGRSQTVAKGVGGIG